MKLARLVPSFLKPMFRPIYRMIIHHPKARNELHDYWRKPWDGHNLPQNYLEGEVKSQFLVALIKRYADPGARILEIGCNVGRNLNHLYLNGFHNLEGIEISKQAVELLKQYYAEMARNIKVYNVSVEDVIKDFEDNRFNIVFTVAVLEHISKNSEWIFAEMVRLTQNYLITIEDEKGISWRHFPRNYRKIFERLGMKQIEEFNCNEVDGLGESFYARVFKNRQD